MRKRLTLGIGIALVLLVGVWLLYPTSAPPVHVVGSLSPTAVDDIVRTIQAGERAKVREALVSNKELIEAPART
jgi:hypothetical protein